MSANRETVRQCAAYFHENPAFARMMKELRRKYERYGRAAGTVVIKDASAAECEAARRIFGETFSAPLKFKAAQFEDALQTTKFQGISLKEVMESYFGEEIKTKRERDAEAEARYCRILRETRTDGETSRRWLEALERTNCGAAQTLKRALSENEAAARLKRRYPERLRLWRMTPDDYRQCKTDVELTEGSMQLLRNCVGLEEIAATVANDGRAGYQEGLLPLLCADLYS